MRFVRYQRRYAITTGTSSGFDETKVYRLPRNMSHRTYKSYGSYIVPAPNRQSKMLNLKSVCASRH